MDTLDRLAEAIRAYDAGAASAAAESLVAEGIDPMQGFDAIAGVLGDVGEKFETGQMWLPDMVGAAETAQAALVVLRAAVATDDRSRTLGKAVLGTVKGDIHSIGIQIVSSLLIGAGFDVTYLGIDVAPEAFVAAVKEKDADLLGLSALLTTTASEARAVLDLLEVEGLRGNVRVMLGGGAITEDFAQAVGADAYGASAAQAVDLALQLMDLTREALR
jgi:methylmalonyl-CoA mutase cobalamin-binding domain/chain